MDLTFSFRNTQGQVFSKTYRNYVLLHSLFAICDMALHREYLPLLPFEPEKPIGPIDGDKDHLKNPPPGFWERDAEKCFKAAKDYLDLMTTCHEYGALVETPMTGFSLFYVLQISKLVRSAHDLCMLTLVQYCGAVFSPRWIKSNTFGKRETTVS